MSASSYMYIDILRDDINFHSEHDYFCPPAVVLYTQCILDALRLPAWIKLVSWIYVTTGTCLRDSPIMILRVHIPTSMSVLFHCSMSCASLTLNFLTSSNPQVQRPTSTWIRGSRIRSEPHSATVLQSAMFSM